MLPLSIFKHRNFLVGNLATFAIYAGLSAATFSIVLYLQQNAGYRATASGLSLLPITILMFILSPRTGTWAEKFGPRWFMALGPIIGALGFAMLALLANPTASYWTNVLPGVLVFGLGLSLTVSPLTAAILGDVDPGQAGIGSAINNAVSRVAGLLSIAAIGLFAGFQAMMLAMATLLIIGGVISGVGIQNHLVRPSKQPR
jgi:MFS family permease